MSRRKQSRGVFAFDYGQRDANYRDTCRTAVHEVGDLLERHEQEYTDLTSASEFALALQGARLIQQFEDMKSNRSTGVASHAGPLDGGECEPTRSVLSSPPHGVKASSQHGELQPIGAF